MVLLHQTRRNSVLKLFFETGSPGFYRKFYNETAKQAGVTSGYENLEESGQSQNYVAIKGKYSARRPRKKTAARSHETAIKHFNSYRN